MLTGGTDLLYREALAAPHRMTARVEIWDGLGFSATQLHPDLPFINGSVQATLNSRVARNMDFTVDASFYPVLETDLLAPYGNVIKAYRGVQLGDGSTTYEWPVFVGRIQRARMSSYTGMVQVTGSDQGSDVVAFGFENPRNSDQGVLIGTQVQTLISEALPDATFGTFDSYTERVQPLTWEQDRGAALDELGFAVGSFWYALADGQFVLRRYPWTVPTAPILTIRDGDGGIITAWDVGRDREGVFNSVTVTGERLNGDGPVFFTARDNTAGSPTQYAGRFGVRTEFLRLQTPDGFGPVQTAAEDALRRDIALVESWIWEQVPDASLELGDVLGIEAAGRTDVIQVVDSINIPLDLAGSMQVTGRSLIVPVLGQASLPS